MPRTVVGIYLNLVHQRFGHLFVQSYISLQLLRPVFPFLQLTMIGGRGKHVDFPANAPHSEVHSLSLFLTLPSFQSRSSATMQNSTIQSYQLGSLYERL